MAESGADALLVASSIPDLSAEVQCSLVLGTGTIPDAKLITAASIRRQSNRRRQLAVRPQSQLSVSLIF